MTAIRLAYAELDVIRNDARAMLAPLGDTGALQLARIEAQVAETREKYVRHAARLGETLGGPSESAGGANVIQFPLDRTRKTQAGFESALGLVERVPALLAILAEQREYRAALDSGLQGNAPPSKSVLA